jgi:hypothetical protein
VQLWELSVALFALHLVEVNIDPLCLSLCRVTEPHTWDFGCSCTFSSLLLGCFKRPTRGFVVDMLERRPHLLEALERGQHKLAVLKHANCVVCLTFSIHWGKCGCYLFAWNIYNLRHQGMLSDAVVSSVSIIVETSRVKLMPHFYVLVLNLLVFLFHIFILIKSWFLSYCWFNSKFHFMECALISIMTIKRSERVLEKLQLIFELCW